MPGKSFLPCFVLFCSSRTFLGNFRFLRASADGFSWFTLSPDESCMRECVEANSGRGILAWRESVATKQMVKKSLECVARAEDEPGMMGSKPILGSMESCKHDGTHGCKLSGNRGRNMDRTDRKRAFPSIRPIPVLGTQRKWSDTGGHILLKDTHQHILCKGGNLESKLYAHESG